MSKNITRRQRSKQIQLAGATRRTRKMKRAKPLWKQSLQKFCKWLLARVAQARTARTERKLKLVESVSLGDKRFIAVVQYEGERFLVGGAANSIAMLARLGENGQFADALGRVIAKKPPVAEPSTVDSSERMIV